MNGTDRGLRYLLSPRSVAIVGASSDFTKFTGRTVKYLLKHGYAGTLYPVNPKRDEIAGVRCYPSISDLPEPVDTAFIQIPARLVPAVLEECIRKGVRSAIIHSAGMGEEDDEGRRREEALKKRAREAGMPVAGPNCAGIANMVQNIILSPIVCYELDRIPRGRIGLISQSGGLTGAYVARAEARGIGFSYVISTGNEMDLDACDYIEYLLDDDGTDVIAVFLEALRNGKRFVEVAEKGIERRKPIIVLKVGRTRVGSRAAESHTGALTGVDAVYEGVFRQTGVIRVQALEDLFEVSALFAKVVPPEGNRVGVVTTTGGGATLLAEAGESAGLDFPAPSDATVEAATEFLPRFAAKTNPMDVTMAGAGGGFKRGLEVLLADPVFDIVVGVVGTSSQFAPELGVQPILEVHRQTEKPLVAFCNPNAEEALRLFEANCIPSFRTPEACGRALGSLVRYGRYLKRKEKPSPRDVVKTERSRKDRVRFILENSGDVLTEHRSKQILSAYGIAVPREILCENCREAREAARKIGYPLVLKVMSPDIVHKTEAGVVRLNIRTEAELEAAYDELLAHAAHFNPQAKIEGVLVQEMVADGVETIVGMYRDTTFGPTVMFGLGGIFVEIFKDVSHRVLPITSRDIREMIFEVRGAVLLEGYRGAKQSDIEGLAACLEKVAELSEDFGDAVLELDINPLRVFSAGRGVAAVDALVRRK